MCISNSKLKVKLDNTTTLVGHVVNSFGDLIFQQIKKETKFHKTSSYLEVIKNLGKWFVQVPNISSNQNTAFNIYISLIGQWWNTWEFLTVRSDPLKPKGFQGAVVVCQRCFRYSYSFWILNQPSITLMTTYYNYD